MKINTLYDLIYLIILLYPYFQTSSTSHQFDYTFLLEIQRKLTLLLIILTLYSVADTCNSLSEFLSLFENVEEEYLN